MSQLKAILKTKFKMPKTTDLSFHFSGIQFLRSLKSTSKRHVIRSGQGLKIVVHFCFMFNSLATCMNLITHI